MQELTDRQILIMNIIIDSIRTKLYPPTLREIAKLAKINSLNGVHDHLKALKRKGYITREIDNSKARGIHITEKSKKLFGLYLGFGEGKADRKLRQISEVLNDKSLKLLPMSVSLDAKMYEGVMTSMKVIENIIMNDENENIEA